MPAEFLLGDLATWRLLMNCILSMDGLIDFFVVDKESVMTMIQLTCSCYSQSHHSEFCIWSSGFSSWRLLGILISIYRQLINNLFSLTLASVTVSLQCLALR